MIYIGIDPGKNGAISMINTDTDFKESIVVPKIGKEYDLEKMCNILRSVRDTHSKMFVVLENINSHSAKGRQGAFVMGKGVAYWQGFLVALKIPYAMTPPQTWQKVCWEGIPVQYIPSKTNKSGKKKDTKATSELAAKRLFPGFDFTPTERATKNHDGMIDSMLIAEYARRKF